MAEAGYSRTDVLCLTELNKETFVAILKGRFKLTKTLVVRIAEALGGDVYTACRIAGFHPPSHYVDVPRMIKRFNLLPMEIQERIAADVEASYEMYRDEKVDRNPLQYIAVQERSPKMLFFLTDKAREELQRKREALANVEPDITEEDTVA